MRRGGEKGKQEQSKKQKKKSRQATNLDAECVIGEEGRKKEELPRCCGVRRQWLARCASVASMRAMCAAAALRVELCGGAALCALCAGEKEEEGGKD